jgi:2-dehydro-3-deoxygluconokinase
MSAALRIACLGECMIELSDLAAPDGRIALGVAGDTLNTAVYLARALPEGVARIAYLTALGEDTLSDRICRFIAAERIETGLIARRADRLPGLYAIETDAAGERRFRYWRETSAARAMFEPGALTLDLLEGFDVIYLSGITLAILPEADRDALLGRLGALRAAGRRIVFDSNHRLALWPDAETARATIDRAWGACSIALPSLDDEIALHGPTAAENVLERIAGLGVAEIALKRGAAGPILHHGTRILRPDCAPAARVVDTTAAGDAFNAGYLAARLTGLTPLAAAQAGHALACRVIAAPGAIIARDA